MSKLSGVIVGPTASGKTAAAVEICQKTGGSIISADSRQIYRQLRFSANKEGEPEMVHLPAGQTRTVYTIDGVRQFGLDLASIDERFTITDFQAEVAFLKSQLPEPLWLVGGSTLYVDAVVYDLNPPAEDLALRAELEQLSRQELLNRLQQKGAPVEQFEQYPVRRLARRLEALEITGQLIQSPTYTDPCLSWFGIQPSLAEVEQNIAERFSAPFLVNLRAEVEELMQNYSAETLAKLGMWVQVTALAITHHWPDATWSEALQIKTRQYAKRQLTWWKRNPYIQWFDSADELLRELST